MIRLYVVRHGIALDPGEWKGDDRSRALTAKGRKRFKRTAKSFSKLEEDVDVMFTSPLVRAVQTAELLARAAGVDDVRVLEELGPDGGPQALLAALAQQTAKGHGVAIVGHDPQLSLLVAHLAGVSGSAARRLSVAKGSIVRVDLPALPSPEGAAVRWTLWPKERFPEEGPPIERTEDERVAARKVEDDRRAARKLEKRAAKDAKRAAKDAQHAEKAAHRAAKKREVAARKEARRPARKRAAAKRPRTAAPKTAKPLVGVPKGPDPRKRVAKPRRSVSVKAPAPRPAAKPARPVAKAKPRPPARPTPIAAAPAPEARKPPTATPTKPIAGAPASTSPAPIAPAPVPAAKPVSVPVAAPRPVAPPPSPGGTDVKKP